MSEADFEGNRRLHLAEEISRQENIQAVAGLLLSALMKASGERGNSGSEGEGELRF